MQPRFERRGGSSPYSLVDQPRFRAAYDFLRLRADCGEIDTELADWWEDFALGTGEEREALIETVREAQRSQPRRVPAAPKPVPCAPLEATPPATPPDATAPAKKRRRRRRKPAAGVAVEGAAAAPESTP